MSTIIAICDGLGIEEETIQYDISPNDVTSLEHVYLERIADLKIAIEQKDRWIRRVFIICLSLIAFIVIVLAVDLLIPTVGWFRGW